MDSTKIHVFQQSIVQYWKQYGRHDLPWRHTSDPWKLLVAEVLLRKTTSSQAVAVYNRIEELSPSEILRTDIRELEHLLFPLGMNKVRAAQLRSIAGTLITKGQEAYQSDEVLRSLQGIGRYISNSVRCVAFGHPAPALDANMIRVIQRVFGWVSERKRPREDKKLWAFAETLVPYDNCREFNWGVLDFAARVCTHRNPKCLECPINNICNYYEQTRSSLIS